MTQAVNDIAVGGTLPDLTICLDLAVKIASTRRIARGGKEDRLEQAGSSLQQLVRDAFLGMAADDDQWLLVDASADELSVHETIWSALQTRFPAFPFT
jgi:dTMP kinase